MKLKYWTGFSKRKNSTKIPTATGTEIDIVLKEDTSIDSPSIILQGNAINIDYCYINTFGKYYFVGAPIFLTNGLTQYDLEEDTLATHKTEVGNTIAHIARSSTGYDTMIPDANCSVMSTKITNYQALNPQVSSMNVFDSTGCYILSVVCTKASGNGFVASYVCDVSILQSLAAFLMALDFTDPQTQLIKSVFKPFDCIISCTWIPINRLLANLQGTSEYICLGDYETNINAVKLSANPRITNTESITLHPQYTDFRSIQPYSTYSFFIPMHGCVDLNPADIKFYNTEALNFTYSIDLAAADISILIYEGGAKIQTINCNIGVNCPIAQTSTNMTGTIASIGGVAGSSIGMGISLLTGNAAGAIASGASFIASTTKTVLNANERAVSSKGGINGRSMVAMGTSFVLMEYAMDTEDCDNANYIAKWGRPVCQTHAINNHSGYVQCENASVDIAGDSWEREQINDFLNNGFYYE